LRKALRSLPSRRLTPRPLPAACGSVRCAGPGSLLPCVGPH